VAAGPLPVGDRLWCGRLGGLILSNRYGLNRILRCMTACLPGQVVGLTVMHNDEQALLALVKNTPSLLEFSKSGFSNVAYVRAAKGNERAYRLLRDMPFVRFVLRNQIIFFCH